MPHLLSHRYFTPSSSLLSVLTEYPCHCPLILCVHEESDSCTMWKWLQKTVNMIVTISLLPTCMFQFSIRLHLQNTSLPTKLVKMSRWQQQSIKTSKRLLWAWCACCYFSRVQLCDIMDCSLPGSSVHGVLQARMLEWVAISFSRGSSWPGNRIHVSHFCNGRQALYH